MADGPDPVWRLAASGIGVRVVPADEELMMDQLARDLVRSGLAAP